MTLLHHLAADNDSMELSKDRGVALMYNTVRRFVIDKTVDLQ